MCSMSLTVVVSARWNSVVMRPGHLVRRQAGVLPDHGDHRDADVREDVGRRAQRRERADDQNQERQHDERVGPAQGNTDQSNHAPGKFQVKRGLRNPPPRRSPSPLPEHRRKR